MNNYLYGTLPSWKDSAAGSSMVYVPMPASLSSKLPSVNPSRSPQAEGRHRQTCRPGWCFPACWSSKPSSCAASSSASSSRRACVQA